jgi:excinuclease ABC subunit C
MAESPSYDLKQTISLLPNQPGVYRYFNEEGKIIYVGKAKNLKKRVASYFNKKSYESRKTKSLVKNIKRIEYTAVNSEADALLLENNFIKEFQPKYNILLKDDKSFPLIKVVKERFPRVFPIRNPRQDGSTYYGPYTSVRTMKGLLQLVKEMFPVRTCNYNLSEENIKAGKFKACLEYQLGNCKAPCVGKQSEQEYNQDIDQIHKILKGYLNPVVQELEKKMQKAAEVLDFEEAHRCKTQLARLKNFQVKSTVVNPKLKNKDVLSFTRVADLGFVNYMKVSEGIIVASTSKEFKITSDDAIPGILSSILYDFRATLKSEATEVILNHPVDYKEEGVKYIQPKTGEKKKLLDLSMKNVLLYRKEKLDRLEHVDPDARANRLMAQMQKDLGLKEEPRHMECFDNSNLQGTNPVSACVVFKNGKPAKKEYRHFNIKTVEGPDDFASMYEVVTRRYKRMLEEGNPLPNLVIVDGGKGQLSSSVQALQDLGIYEKLPIIGIAKRLEEIYYPEDPIPLHVDKRSETLKVIQRMRDEAHRFGITHHRSKRLKSVKSSLDEIPGIGPTLRNKLLKEFKSVAKVKNASLDDLKKVLGSSKAELVFNHFKSNPS